MTSPINTLPDGTTERKAEQPSGIAQILTGTKLALLAVVVAGGITGKPQEVRAQEAIFPIVESSLSKESLAELCAGDRGALDTDTLVACFTYDIAQHSESEITLFANTWNRLTDDQKNSVYGFFAAGMNSKEALEEVASKHVPLGLHEAIIQEAIANGADSDLEIPGLEDALITLQQTGDIDTISYDMMVEYAPTAISQLPIHEKTQTVQARLIDAEGRLVDAEGRLVDAEGRLVDAEGRLVDAQNVGNELDSITEQLTN